MAHHMPENSPIVGSLFPQPAQPEKPPFKSITQPPHISIEVWQTSYYDASDPSPMGAYAQRPAGPCDITTGRLLGDEWPTNAPKREGSEGHRWKQV